MTNHPCDPDAPAEYVSASELINRLFSEVLQDPNRFDPEVVAIVKQHLGGSSVHSKAGANLAAALLELATSKTPEERA